LAWWFYCTRLQKCISVSLRHWIWIFCNESKCHVIPR
jgi:hypothetical protein